MKINRYISSLLCLCILAFTTSCITLKEEKKNTLVLDYSEFGPAVLSYELLGQAWWQWWPHGDGNPDTEYDIKVVVFDNISEEQVKQLYPVSEKEQMDFRYVSKEAALGYFDETTAELRAWRLEGNFDVDKGLSKILKTQQKVISHFQFQ